MQAVAGSRVALAGRPSSRLMAAPCHRYPACTDSRREVKVGRGRKQKALQDWLYAYHWERLILQQVAVQAQRERSMETAPASPATPVPPLRPTRRGEQERGYQQHVQPELQGGNVGQQATAQPAMGPAAAAASRSTATASPEGICSTSPAAAPTAAQATAAAPAASSPAVIDTSDSSS
ncbi:hypothetical protein D9Q98_004535 [Chlorella vulgaris]|uniref:Uncharacterized protein n=1 Tax=Chlorella vulgaris TaxID=3077 RepID=A0A9D4TR52_CHLVU|nr:hypothetical protein D9Q98_004535 [Chlorella vulgaris]